MGRKDEYLTKVDNHIGSKIYNLRLAQGYSRKQLASMIKVSNQQLHKYETGINRICVGRLMMLAKALNEDISYFYVDMNENEEQQPAKLEHQRMCIEIARNFMKIGSKKHRKAINSLIKSMIDIAPSA
ncbi:MAG: hypothetical protein DGJ47_000562 [Rickettsiaceae bacterium]